MEQYVIKGGVPLNGEVSIGGAKNAALGILAAAIMTDETVTIENVPNVRDTRVLLQAIEGIGAKVKYVYNNTVQINGGSICDINVDYEYIKKIRASYYLLGALLGKYKRSQVALPGGCNIGSRPIDLHLKGFHLMGAKSRQAHGMVELQAKTLRGSDIYLDFPSVGATENILLAATRAKGITTIENAAAEPEICDLADFLRKMGAEIEGDGTDTITIRGGKELHGAVHRVIPDRMEAGTFLAAAAITGGDIILENVQEEHLKPVLAKLAECNIKTERTAEGIRVRRRGRLCGVQVKTMPFPGFPTDMQAPFMSLLAVAKGTSVMTETIFENRFSHVGELQRMGANIKIDSRSAVIEGVETLTGAKVRATDLRAGAALILSALAAKGETEISDIYHIERGYDRIDEKLRRLGADIRREEE